MLCYSRLIGVGDDLVQLVVVGAHHAGGQAGIGADARGYVGLVHGCLLAVSLTHRICPKARFCLLLESFLLTFGEFCGTIIMDNVEHPPSI